MARRKRYDDESMRNSGSVGYSKQALEALERGTYGKTTGRQAQYRTSQEQTQPAKKVPALEGMTRSPEITNSFGKTQNNNEDLLRKASQYQQNLETDSNNYKFNTSARKANTLDADDMKFLQKHFDEYGDSARTKKALYESKQTQGWEKKYGKSLDQIYKDFLADQGNVNIERGAINPIKSGIESALGIIPQIGAAGASLVGNLISPDSKFAKGAEELRHENEVTRKQKKEGVKAYAKSRVDVADKVLGSPKSLKGAEEKAKDLIGTGVETAYGLSDRMIPSMLAKASKVPLLDALASGLSDYNTQMEEVRNRPDMSARQKAATAGAHAAVEGLGTAVTMGILDKIPAANGLAGKALNVLKGAGNGAFENWASEGIEQKLDKLVSGDLSKQELTKGIYMLNGMTPEEAEAQVKKDARGERLGAAGTGALFGGAIKGISEVTNSIPVLKELKGNNAEVDAASAPKIDEMKIQQFSNDTGASPDGALQPGAKTAGFTNPNVPPIDENVNRTEGASDNRSPMDLDPAEQARQLEMARIRTELDLNLQMQEAIRTGRDADGRMVTGVTDADAELRRLSAERESLERQLNELSTPDERTDADLDALTNFVNSQRRPNGQPPVNDGGNGNIPPQNPPQPPNNGNVWGNVPPSNNGGGNVPPNTPINLTQDANGNVVESGTSQHLRSAVDVRVATPMKYDIPDEVAMEFVKDPQMYKQLKNADTKALSDAIYDSGDEPVTINGKVYEGNPEAKFRVLLSEKNPASLPLGDKIAKDYSAQGNHDMAAQIYRDMGRSLTEAGQFTQASAISMMKNDPLSALAYMEKEIDALNKAGADKYGKKWNNFELTDAEREMFNNIAPGDEKAIKAAYDKVGERIEREYPASAWEKVLEFRRVAMLLNTRTIVRNTLANPPTAGLRYISDRIEGVGQAVAHLINPDFEVTQSITGSNVKTRKLASEIFKSDKVQNLLKEVPGKLSEVPKVGDYAKSKQVFKGGIVSDFINKLTDNGIEKLNAKLGKKGAKSALELARNTAYSALEVTDSPFVRENFISRLGSYMKAKGIDNVKDVPDEAINIALEEALKATYKDDSWLVQGIRKAKGSMESIGNGIMPGVRLGDMASQALIPYVQAPGNIGARIIDYSPIGGTRGIANIINGATKNDTKAIAKGIEEFSKGATGTMMAALGMALYRSGILTGTYSDDKDQKAFEKKNGFREFAIKYQSPLDGKTKYDTIDWAQPFVDTLMPGVLLAQAIDNSDGYDSDILRYFGIEDSSLGKGLGIAGDTIGKNINYFFSATPLKNLSDLLGKKGYGETDIASNLRENIVEDFASALVPAGINALAKSVDTTQRQTFNPDNTFGSFLNSNIAKIPGLSKVLPVKYDTWGQPMTNGDSMGEAAYKKMFYPGEHTTDTNDAIDNEINRLFNATQNNGVFPQVAPYSVDGVKLTDKEYSEYQRTMGQRNRQMVESLFNSPAYQSLDDETRADIVDNLFKASKAIANYEIKGKEYTNTDKKIGELYASGGVDAVVNNYLSKDIAKSAGLSTSSKAAKEIEQAVQSGNIQAAQQMATEASAAKEAAANAGMFKDDGSVNTEHYQKVMARAGSQSSRMQNDLPALKGMGLPDSADYVYANAINVNPNITVPEFTQTYDEIDTDKSNKLTQKEMLAYINKYQFSNDPNEDLQMATDLYRTYQDGTWKKQLYLKKDGTYGLK